MRVGQEERPESLWITIGKDGTIEHGTHVPDLWGLPQSC